MLEPTHQLQVQVAPPVLELQQLLGLARPLGPEQAAAAAVQSGLVLHGWHTVLTLGEEVSLSMHQKLPAAAQQSQGLLQLAVAAQWQQLLQRSGLQVPVLACLQASCAPMLQGWLVPGWLVLGWLVLGWQQEPASSGLEVQAGPGAGSQTDLQPAQPHCCQMTRLWHQVVL